MKKNYVAPQQRVIELQHNLYLLTGSNMNEVGNNVKFNYVGGGSVNARSRDFDWDDDWDDE
jgi:hypothetical protein